MAALTRKDVEEIALLARLELSGEEIESLAGELSAVLAHMETLQELSTEGIEPMTHAVPMMLRLRDDVVEASLSVGDAVDQAPDRKDGCFRVPHIIKTAAEK